MKSLQTRITPEDILIKNLQKLIAKQKQSLMRLTERLEQLKIDIQRIEDEYDARIGNLYKKDILLDLEIIRFKKINELMDQGYSYEDALMQLHDTMASEDINFEDVEEYILVPETEELTQEKGKDIKKLWKKLVHKFHPDLSQNTAEREKRDQIMKKINKAYANKDLDALMAIQDEEFIEDSEGTTSMKLEETYVAIQNAIIRVTKHLGELKASKWFVWLRKTPQEREALFQETGAHISDDVRTKEILLRSLKRKHNLI